MFLKIYFPKQIFLKSVPLQLSRVSRIPLVMECLPDFPLLTLRQPSFQQILRKIKVVLLPFPLPQEMHFSRVSEMLHRNCWNHQWIWRLSFPLQYTGDVIGDLNARRGRVRGLEERSGLQVISGEVPLSEMFGYSTQLLSLIHI